MCCFEAILYNVYPTSYGSNFSPESLDVALTGGQQYFVSFAGEAYGVEAALISNVSVDLLQADAPEPPSLSFLGGALGFLLLARWAVRRFGGALGEPMSRHVIK